MSNVNNDVMRVLATTGDQPVIAVGSTLEDLAVGQLGFFDEKTKLAVDDSSTKKSQIFLALRTAKGLIFSGGQYIQTSRVRNLSYRPHTPGQSQIVKISNFLDAECDSDYNVKIEIRDQEKYRIQGYNQYSKTFSVRTACCIGTQTITDGNDLAVLLSSEINKDEGGEFSSVLTARQVITTTTHGTSVDYAVDEEVSEADAKLLVIYNTANPTTKVYVDIQITFDSLAVQEYCNINLKYWHPRQIFGIVSPLEDLVCIGTTVTTTQEIAFSEGMGYDVKQKEYHSEDGSGPYPTLAIPGVAKQRSFVTDESENYDQFYLEYDFKTNSGWKEYENAISTLVAIPVADTTTRTSFATILDSLFADQGFDSLISDATATDPDPLIVEKTTDKGVDDDGLT